jgi:hypothetical protein
LYIEETLFHFCLRMWPTITLNINLSIARHSSLGRHWSTRLPAVGTDYGFSACPLPCNSFNPLELMKEWLMFVRGLQVDWQTNDVPCWALILVHIGIRLRFPCQLPSYCVISCIFCVIQFHCNVPTDPMQY